jgi:hypothetical protein
MVFGSQLPVTRYTNNLCSYLTQFAGIMNMIEYYSNMLNSMVSVLTELQADGKNEHCCVVDCI